MLPLKRIFMMVPTLLAGLCLGWVLVAQQAPTRTWKGQNGGREEYDLYDKAAKATDAKQRLVALDEWKNKFPDTDFWGLREEFYLATYQQLSDCRKAFDTAVQIRQKRPKHLLALNAILTCVYPLNPAGQAPNAADLTATEEASKFILDSAASNVIYAPDNKPEIGTVNDEQLKQAKPALEKAAQQTYAWVFVRREDWAKAEPELRKFLALDPTQAAFSLYLAQALSNQARVNPTAMVGKYVEAMFHYARVAAYNGPGAVSAQVKEQALNFLKTAYTTYHGSEEGMQQVLSIAATNVMPPPGFTIKDVNTIRQEEFAKAQAWDQEHPDLAFWRDAVKTPLTGPDANSLFEATYKDATLPGEAGALKGVSRFKGKILSSTQDKAGDTTQLILGVFDASQTWNPTTPEATINILEDPLPGTMENGGVILFQGVPKSFTPNPFMIVFEAEAKDIEGWTGQKAAKAKAKAAPKGGTKAGKAAPKAAK